MTYQPRAEVVEYCPFVHLLVGQCQLRDGQCKTTHEDTGAPKHGALISSEQAVTPVQRLVQCLLAARSRTRAAREHTKAFVQPLADTSDTEQGHTCCGEFNR